MVICALELTSVPCASNRGRDGLAVWVRSFGREVCGMYGLSCHGASLSFRCPRASSSPVRGASAKAALTRQKTPVRAASSFQPGQLSGNYEMPSTVERVCRERSRCVRMNLEGPLSAAAPTPTDHGWATPHSSGFRRLGPGSARFPARGPRLPSSRPSRSFVCRLQHRRTISGHPSGLGYQLAHALGPWSALIYLSSSRVSINGPGLDSCHGGGKYRSCRESRVRLVTTGGPSCTFRLFQRLPWVA